VARRTSRRTSRRTAQPAEELTDKDQAAMAADAGDTAESAAPAAPPPQPAPDDSYLDELERLAALRDQGIISEADFEAKKQQLLGL